MPMDARRLKLVLRRYLSEELAQQVVRELEDCRERRAPRITAEIDRDVAELLRREVG